jgi:hypothetical protein
VPDLTSELQRMADDGARQARALAADDVIQHGDRRWRRTVMWRSVGGLSMAGVVAAVALAVAAPAGHRASPQPGIQLTAWTVVKRADGTVSVAIRELRDPAGLQRRLRADGVPASVTFSGGLPRSCRLYPTSPALIKTVFTERHAGRFPVMVIHPSALPAGAGVEIGAPVQRPIVNVSIGLVRASPRCTGS